MLDLVRVKEAAQKFAVKKEQKAEEQPAIIDPAFRMLVTDKRFESKWWTIFLMIYLRLSEAKTFREDQDLRKKSPSPRSPYTSYPGGFIT